MTNRRMLDKKTEESLRIWAGGMLSGVFSNFESVPTPPLVDCTVIEHFLNEQGIDACLQETLQNRSLLKPFFLAYTSTKHRIAVEMLRQQAFLVVIDALQRECPNVTPVIIKGQALAYQLYPRPWLRPRGDIDALVAEEDVDKVAQVLLGLGYEHTTAIDGGLVLRQTSFRLRQRGISHTWDLHWSISNRPALADVLSYHELLTSAVKVPLNGRSFLAPDNVTALLVACAHLVGHHLGEPRMIWLYDIHLLAQSLTVATEQRFLERAACHKSLRTACHMALSITSKYMPLERTTRLAQALDPGPGRRWRTNERYLWRLLDDAHAVGRGRRLQLLRQHLFPAREYMMQRFHIQRRWQLPFWYAIRGGRAIPKLFRRR